MPVLVVILSITCDFFLICPYIFIRDKLSGEEMCPLLIYPSIFRMSLLITKIRAQVSDQPL